MVVVVAVAVGPLSLNPASLVLDPRGSGKPYACM